MTRAEIEAMPATDVKWKAVQRADGSIFFTAGDPAKGYHCAFDIELDDFPLATTFADAVNNCQRLQARLAKLTAFVTAIAADHGWPEHTRKLATEALREAEGK